MAITYYVSPVFRHSFTRYFTGHRFFTDDIKKRHLRTLVPGGSILIQHALLAGIICYCVGNSLFSASGRAFLISSYPLFSLWGKTPFSYFWWGFLASSLFEIICVLWLLFVNPSIKYLSQIFNLYPWILEFNLVLATIGTTVYLAQTNAFLLYTAAVLFLLIFLAAFIFASIDTTKFLVKRKRLKFTGYTTILYSAIIVIAGIWCIFFTQLLSITQQAAAMP